ncbi:hypothetical protein INS49_006591 [Diaporthe citri]|uniref:uncharacterized protein n=1 Tax=Diaporthe citri TaxID=83186 RepID=UPI001C7EAC8B|nr:uncharacterized protein INS49_006591 [Diaporthe citri]KAG6364986.1 hypothetical protein INS49_006591 [Diaporthe citri]
MPSIDAASPLPLRQTAVVAQGAGKLAIQHDVPIPVLAPDMAIVKTAAVAINPVDAKILDFSPAPGAIDGYDFAGTIVALGEEVTASGRFAVGDRVAGMVFGMNKLKPDIGAFAQYVGACADILLKIPKDMSFEEASGLGLGVATAAMALFKELQVPASLEDLREGLQVEKELKSDDFVLVAGGSTATGTRAIQLLKLAGLRPIATCSPANFELATRFGAEMIFDYRSPTCAENIRAYTGNQLEYALDCVTQADTTQMCYASLGRAGGRYVALEPFRDSIAQSRSATVEASWLMVLTIFGGQVALDGDYYRDTSPEDRKVGAELFAVVQGLLDRGLIDPHPVKVMPGGWHGVVEAVDTIRKQPQSGHKLVCPVS